jgi:hypothetical protein
MVELRPLRLVGCAALLAVAGCCGAPGYQPGFWNDGATVQYDNNCYNYANNKRTDTFAQPGRAAGAQYKSLFCDDVRAAAIADGLTALPDGGTCGGDCKLALVTGEIYPGRRDFHWYRQDADNTWSHKPGANTARNVDNSGQPIVDPQAANRDGYTDFCGYMCTCSSGTQGQGPAKIN